MRLPFLERYSKLDDHEDGDFGLEEIEDKARSQRQYQGHRRLQRSLLILQIQVSVLMLICFVLGFFLLRSFNLSNRATIDTLLGSSILISHTLLCIKRE